MEPDSLTKMDDLFRALLKIFNLKAFCTNARFGSSDGEHYLLGTKVDQTIDDDPVWFAHQLSSDSEVWQPLIAPKVFEKKNIVDAFLEVMKDHDIYEVSLKNPFGKCMISKGSSPEMLLVMADLAG